MKWCSSVTTAARRSGHADGRLRERPASEYGRPSSRHFRTFISEDGQVLDQERQSVAPQWQRHLERPFPPRLRGEEIEGVDMVTVDADIAGCVQTWLNSSSDLDKMRTGVLRGCLDDLDRVLPQLSDPEEADYYAGLRDLAARVLSAQRARP